MRDSSPSYFVGLDIGTTQVRCVIGSIDSASEDPKIAVIGMGKADNTGVRKGIVVHLDEVVSAITAAVSEAERISGLRIENATININGSHVSSLESKGVVAISTADREISIDDKLRAEEAATILQLPSNREIVQVFPKNYQVDGHDSIKDPVGMHGVRLEVETQIITAASPNLRTVEAAMQKAGVYANHRTSTGLAASEIVLSKKQREAGALVLDMGASTTNLAVIEDGEIQHVAVIPMGGINITNDLAIGLKVDLDIAEKIKLKHAAVADAGKEGRVSVDHDKRNHVFEAEDVKMIVEARVEEIFEFVDKELKKVHRSQKLPGGIVLVGGCANIPGIDQLAKDKLGLAAKIGSMSGVGGIVDGMKDVSFVPVVGLMHLDMLFSSQAIGAYGNGGYGSPEKFTSLMRNIWQRIKP